ncbi:hypothetical protein FHY68_18215 [Bacillus pacificus]|nr:hypothetical protein FHY68_18215 [Bacillus pacificus]
MIIRQLTFLYNNFAYVFSNLLLEKEKGSMHDTTEKYTVNEIKMDNNKKSRNNNCGFYYGFLLYVHWRL